MPDRINVQFRTLRRASGLVQEDIAFLLGFKAASTVSRFEQRSHEPDIRTALACEHILGAPVRTLFEPVYAEVGRLVQTRARQRLDSLTALVGDARHAARLAHLARLAEQPPTLFKV
ncbi:MAG: helix-turn-helix transcriptional regulator [Hydrogenophilaceae bacterium]|nr:helix-turn-helix transcriptional regulator [Hydrogenophilaceae bacterium]